MVPDFGQLEIADCLAWHQVVKLVLRRELKIDYLTAQFFAQSDEGFSSILYFEWFLVNLTSLLPQIFL
jgi:hypothetical protein